MKKLLAILGVITCMISLCACGQEDTASAPYSEAELMEIGETTVMQLNMIVAQGVIEQYVEDPIIYAGLVSWQNALKDIGEYEGTNGGTVSVSEDEIVISINVLGSSHNAIEEIIFDGSMAGYVAMTTNVEYSFGETISKAVMNTVIGMGTVFVVLIFISLIISCFGLISKVGTKKKKKEAAAVPESVTKTAPAAVQIAEKEELSDDTELVAVIAAAVAAYEGSGSTDGFVVRSIRKSNKSKWQNA